MVTLTLAEKRKVRVWAHGLSTKPTLDSAIKYIQRTIKKNVGRSTVGRVLGPEYRYLDDIDAASPRLKRKNTRQCRYPELERLLMEWQVEMEEQGLGTTGALLQQKAIRLWRTTPEVRGGKDEEPVPEFGNSWLDLVKNRFGLQRRTFHGEAASASASLAAGTGLISQIREEVAGIPVGNRYNMDETGLFWRRAPSMSLATKNRPGVKKDKARVTLVLTTNDTGDDRVPIWVIGTAMKPRALAKFPFEDRGLVYKSNRKAWMTGDIMGQWLKAFYAHIAAKKPGQKVILLLDNFTGHSKGIEFAPPPPNITVRFLPPGTTSAWQPMDAGIISAFKTFYRKSFMHWYGAREGSPNFLKELTLEDAMLWTSVAWYASVSAVTIRNCWRKSTLLEVGQEEVDQREVGQEGEGQGGESTPVADDEVGAARAALRVMYDAAVNPGDEDVLEFDRFVEYADDEETLVERLSEDEILDKLVSHWRAELAEQAEPEPPAVSPQEALKCVETLVEYAAQRKTWKLPDLVALYQMQEMIRVEHTNSLQQTTLGETWRLNLDADSSAMDVDSSS
jgi:hypothetical protein